jgi:hypothetical protein
MQDRGEGERAKKKRGAFDLVVVRIIEERDRRVKTAGAVSRSGPDRCSQSEWPKEGPMAVIFRTDWGPCNTYAVLI